MEKLKLHSPNLVEKNIEQIAALFPNCITETKAADGAIKQAVDFDQLRQELSDTIVEGPRERYHLNWPGKREAMLTANAPIAKTLRPCREESVNFDTTKNLFVEGDNLDALKLLQETYLNKVKMIYIDPPYNTGKDFVYSDSFKSSTEDYYNISHQSDETGNRLILNPESQGRFHSAWLSMVYPRIKLARTLLREDGVFITSIDYRESSNMRKMCDEIFGENNFIAEIAWEKMYTTKNDSSLVSCCHENILIYAKQVGPESLGLLPRTAEMDARYTNPDKDPRGNWKAIPLYADGERKNGRFPVTSPTGNVHEPASNSHWRYSENDVQKLIEDKRIYFGKDGNAKPNLKRFLTEVQPGVKAKTLWFHKDSGSNDSASRELKSLFGGTSPFSFPKPTLLLKKLLQLGAADPDSIVLDFFAGSASTADSVMSINLEDGGNRKYILVQIPEESESKSNAAAMGFKTVSDISLERIRKSGRNISEENATTATSLDVGFRLLKVDTSNMKDVYYSPDAINQEDLFSLTENIKEDRTSEDLLFQVLLDWGVDLSLPISSESISKKTVFFVDENALAACFDSEVSEELVTELAKRKPLRAVFRDSCFSDDSMKINVEQIFKTLSPSTEVRSI